MSEETKETALAELHNSPVKVDQSTIMTDLLFDDLKYNRLYHFAEVMASGKSTVPAHLQGNTADCMAICLQSAQWGLNPIVVAQKTHLVNGVLGYEAQLVHAVILNSGLIKGRVNYEYVGDWSNIRGKRDWDVKDEQGLGVKVSCVIRETGEVKDWTTYMLECRIRNSPNWKTKPMLQTSYQAIKEWCREHAPDVLLGVYTTDELYDDRPTITVSEVKEGGLNESRTDKLAGALGVNDEIDVEATEVDNREQESEIKRVSKKMLDEALEAAGVSGDMLFDYAIAKGAITPDKDIYSIPANWKRSIVEDPKSLHKKVNDWLAEEENTSEDIDLDKLRRNFHAVGVEVYGDGWDDARAQICDGYEVVSSNDLTESQLIAMIEKMNQIRNR